VRIDRISKVKIPNCLVLFKQKYARINRTWIVN
jgi:hypothetical protein